MKQDEFACVSSPNLSGVSVYVFPAVCDFADYPPSRPAAEQKVHGGVGSLVKGLTLPSNMVPMETRHKTSCQHQTIINCTCVISVLFRCELQRAIKLIAGNLQNCRNNVFLMSE